jgi:hypothetical protein
VLEIVVVADGVEISDGSEQVQAVPAPRPVPCFLLLKTRFALDQYINLRPVKLYPNVETPLKDKGPEHVDFVVVRENTGGIYTGVGGVTQKGTPLEVATQVMQYSRPVVGPRGEPPSSARRVPSREGMETLPGFPS